MIKSIVSGGVILVADVAIVLGLLGAYDLSDAALITWGAVGLIATILFASFGGFKPFFRALGSGHTAQEAESDTPAEVATHRDSAVSDESGAPSQRRLISIGADPTSLRLRPLFEERPPTEDSADEVEPEDASSPPDRPPRRPLFGEALAERLAEERAPVDELDDGADDGEIAAEGTRVADESSDVGPIVEAVKSSIGIDEAAVEADDGESAEEIGPEADAGDDQLPVDEPTEGIVVDADPDWVGREDHDGDGPAIDVGGGDHVVDDEVDTELTDGPAEVEGGDDTEVAPSVPDREAAPAIDAEPTDLPVVLAQPAAIELHRYSTDEVMAIVRAQESDLVESLIDEGLLTTAGPITDRDVRTMVFVAVSSNELIDMLAAARDGEARLSYSDPAELTTGTADD